MYLPWAILVQPGTIVFCLNDIFIFSATYLHMQKRLHVFEDFIIIQIKKKNPTKQIINYLIDFKITFIT